MTKLLNEKKLVKTVLALAIALLYTNNAAKAEVDPADCKQANALLRTAYLQMLRGEFQLAAVNHKRAVIADRDSVAARRHLGYSLLRLGNYKEALEQLHVLEILTEPTAFDMCLFGEAYFQSGQYKIAENWFCEALKSNSEFVNARIGLAKSLAAGKSNDVTANDEQKSPGVEVPKDFASAHNVRPLPVSASAVIATHDQPVISVLVAPVKRKYLGNNQTHNAWESYRGLQSK